MKNKIISLFILFALVLSACGSDTNSSKSGDNNTAEPEEAKIEETVIYDENDIVITAVDLEYDGIFRPTLNLLVENNSDKDYIIQCDYATINGFMISYSTFSASVSAGKKSNESISFFDDAIDDGIITTISDMTFVFYGVDPDTYLREFESEEVSLSTSASGSYEQPMPDGGYTLYDKDGVQIIIDYHGKDSDGNEVFSLLFKNDSGSDMIISCDDMSVNDFMAESYIYATLKNGSVYYDLLSFTEEELNEVGIENIENIQMKFEGRDVDTYSEIFSTDTLIFTVDK